MSSSKIVYQSFQNKTEEQAHEYLKTHEAPHRYLAYKNIPKYIRKFVNGKRALDFGCGTGASAAFLYKLGFDILGVDISLNMIEKARENAPHIAFLSLENVKPESDFDLVFSSFVLFEIGSKENITEYLKTASSFLKKEGIFIAITGSEHLYSLNRNWMTFDANFPENQSLKSGDIAKLLLKCASLEFYDYFWKESDYQACFEEADFQILEIHHPLGLLEEGYEWQDELSFSPFLIFIAKKK